MDDFKKEKKRVKNAILICSYLDVTRYMMSVVRHNGSEKADCHKRLCRIFVSVFCDIDYDKVTVLHNKYKLVHDHTTALTDHLDKIGLPLHEDGYVEYDDYHAKFFNRFYKLATEALKAYA